MSGEQSVEESVRQFLVQTDEEWPFVFLAPAKDGHGDILVRTGKSEARQEILPRLAGLFILALSEYSDVGVYEVAEDVAGYAETVQNSEETVTFIRD